jgi:hypothetical protein
MIGKNSWINNWGHVTGKPIQNCLIEKFNGRLRDAAWTSRSWPKEGAGEGDRVQRGVAEWVGGRVVPSHLALNSLLTISPA